MVELIPKKDKRADLPWQKTLFFISFVALAVVAAAYIILFFSANRAALNIQSLEGEIAKRGTAAEKQMEQEVFDAEARINFFSQVFDKYRKPSQVFPKLEERTHPQAQFNSFDLNLETGVLELHGRTLNFQTLSQQISALREESAIKALELSDISLGEEGQTEFTARIIFDARIFK